MKEKSNEDLRLIKRYQEDDKASYGTKEIPLIIPKPILTNDDSAECNSLHEPETDPQNSSASLKMESGITYAEFSLAIYHAKTILSHLYSEGEITPKPILNQANEFELESSESAWADEAETESTQNSLASDIYDYVRSLPFSKMIDYKFNYKANLYTIANHHNRETAGQIDYIFKLMDDTKDRALGYNLFVKEVINKVPYDIEASSVLPLLLYKIKTEDNLEAIRIAAEFTCKLSGFTTNDWLVESAIYITQREIPSHVIMKHLGNSITCLCDHSNNANEIIEAYFNQIQNYKTTVGKIATIKVTEDFVSHVNMKSQLHGKAITIMKSYIDDEDIKFKSVKVILDIFQIKESSNQDNNEWAVRLANAVRIANYKYHFIDTHPFLEKTRAGEIQFNNKEFEEVLDINQLDHCPDGYHNCNNEVDIYIVNSFNE